MGAPRPVLVTKVTTSAQALDESACALANANEDRAAGKLKTAETWDRRSQYWLDRYNDLVGDGELSSTTRRARKRSSPQ